jgi:ankyrin repeat protein
MLSQLEHRIPLPTSAAALPVHSHGQTVAAHAMVQAFQSFLPHRGLPKGSNMDEATRLAGVLQVLMPEEQDEGHRMTSEVLCSPSNNMGLQERFKLLFYLLSNNLSLHSMNGPRPCNFSEPDMVEQDGLILKVLRISGLNTLENMKHLFAMPGLTPRSIAEKVFGSAVRYSDSETITVMLEAGMDPQTPVLPDDLGWNAAMTPLEYFCRTTPSVRMAKLLLSRNADVNAYKCAPCLALALFSSHSDLVDLLISHGANIDDCLTRLNSCEYSDDTFHTLRPFLDRLVHDTNNRKDRERLATLLAISIKAQEVEWVEFLIARDADVNSLHEVYFEVDFSNTTAVGLAAESGNMEILRVLLAANVASAPQSTADPDIIQPLTLAVDRGHADATLLLINCGGDMNTVYHCSGTKKTLFDRALEKGKLEICESLLQTGAAVEEGTLQHFYGERLCSLVAKKDVDRILQLPLQEIDLNYRAVNRITNGRGDRTINGTALGIAIEMGHVQIIGILLRAGATDIGSPLERFGGAGTAQYLDHVGLLPRVLNSSGQNLLVAAIDADDDTLVEYLILHLPTEKLSQRRTWRRYKWNQRTGTPLEAAIRKGKLATMEALLARGARITDAELTAAVDRYLWHRDELALRHIVGLRSPLKCKAPMALAKALKAENRELVEILLCSGLDLTGWGYSRVLETAAMIDDEELFQRIFMTSQWSKEVLGSAFTWSIRHGKRASMQYLHDAGADLNQSIPGELGQGHWFPLQIAVQNKDISVIKTLIEYGCDPDESTESSKGSTPLQRAAEDGNVEIVNLLLGAGADPDAVPIDRVDGFFIRHGTTALQSAVRLGHMELMERLLDAGADVNSAPGCNSGATALQFAAIQGFIGIARKLLELGADVNAGRAAQYGRTALEGAAEHGRLDMVQFLLANGALIDGRGRRQYIRAVKLAEWNGYSTIATFLRTHGQWTAVDTQQIGMEDYETDPTSEPDFENDLAWDYKIPWDLMMTKVLDIEL